MFESRRWTIFFRLTPEGPLRSVSLCFSWKWILPTVVVVLGACFLLGYFTRVGLRVNRVKLAKQTRAYQQKIKQLQNEEVPIQELRRRSNDLKQKLDDLRGRHKLVLRAAGFSGSVAPFPFSKRLPNVSGDPGESSLNETVHALERWNNDLEQVKKYARARVGVLRKSPMMHPTTGWLSSPYGNRVNPMGGSEKSFHSGLDIAATRGTPVHATARGTVVYAGWNSGSGRAVKVRHGFGFTTAYNHLSRIEVEEGETVDRGEVLGRVGNTGWSTGNHLHYEVQIWEQSVDPLPYLVESFGPARVSLRKSDG